jgi:hypothetical protein
MIGSVDIDVLPGGDLVRQGLEDLAAGRESEAALLVLIGSPRLRRLGLAVAESGAAGAEHRLYARLAAVQPDSAHSRYNALVRRLVSFERAAECAGWPKSHASGA